MPAWAQGKKRCHEEAWGRDHEEEGMGRSLLVSLEPSPVLPRAFSGCFET